MSQLELELSPTVTAHVAPIEQSTSQEEPHVPLQLVPAPQLTCWLPPLGMAHANPRAHARAPGAVTVQPGPGHADALRPPSPPPSLRSTALTLDPQPTTIEQKTKRRRQE
jgi:hypothetical protein